MKTLRLTQGNDRFSFVRTCLVLGLLACWGTLVLSCAAQADGERADSSTTVGSEDSATIIIKAKGDTQKQPVFFTASSTAHVQIDSRNIEQEIELKVQVVQGKAETLRFGLQGQGEVRDVQGAGIQSWSIRQEVPERFLELHLEKDTKELNVTIKIRSPEYKIPGMIDITHLAPGNSIGFSSLVHLKYAIGVQGIVKSIEGFAPLAVGKKKNSYQTTTGGKIRLSLNRDGAGPAPIELVDTRLRGELHPNGKSLSFQLNTTAEVTEAGTEIPFLSGNAALLQVPTNDNYRLRLTHQQGKPVYMISFAKTGKVPVKMEFVAAIQTTKANRKAVDFTVAASAVVPLELHRLDSNLEFHRNEQFVIPLHDEDKWLGFLPATGRAQLQWRTARKSGLGKLFFTTQGLIETRIGAGLLRQDHQIDYQVLQGELKSISMVLHGPGEIVDVQGPNLLGWKVTGEGNERQLSVSLSQPITASRKIMIRSQTPLGAFPTRKEGLRITPVGAIRHSGYLRLTNAGLVRFEPTKLAGLTQLSPKQFPAQAISARQVLVYRFPAADHKFEVEADRIQPEVNISQLVLYQLSETDRVMKANIELDIREAPIREWRFRIPANYSVVSVTGASVADYIAATEVTDDTRNLKVIFSQDIAGRQLIHLHLEKSEPALETDWKLPRIEYPGAKSVRGDIGIVGAPGFRIGVGETDLLVERPLSYFPSPVPNLQQAFRIRESEWTATMLIERLERSIHSDVFHLYSLSQGTVYGSALINYFITGAPISELKLKVPDSLGNVIIDGQDVRTWRRQGEDVIVSLHQPVMGSYTLLVTFEEKPESKNNSFQAGLIAPAEVQGERGYIQVVSPMQVEVNTLTISDDILKLDPLELPAELQLLSAAPALGTWQYTQRPFKLDLKVDWFEPGTTLTQVVEFSEANSRVSKDGELVTDVLYYVKSRGQRTLKIKLPDAPVKLWEVTVNKKPVTARQAGNDTLIPLPGGSELNVPIEVRLRLGKPTVSESSPVLTLPTVYAPIVKTQWNINGDEQCVLVPTGGTVEPPEPVLRPTGYSWVAQSGIGSLLVIGLLTSIGIALRDKSRILRLLGLISLGVAIYIAAQVAHQAFLDRGGPTPLRVSLPILSVEESVEMTVQNMPLWRVNLSWLGLLLVLGGAAALIQSFVSKENSAKGFARAGGALLFVLGILLQRDSAAWFFGLLAFAIFALLFLGQAWHWLREVGIWFIEVVNRRKKKKEESKLNEQGGSGIVTALLVIGTFTISAYGETSFAASPDFQAANSVEQVWHIAHEESRLQASGTITLTGSPGDQFLLLKAPAVLTHFQSTSLRLTKQNIPGQGLAYVISIPTSDEAPTFDEFSDDDDAFSPIKKFPQNSVSDYEAVFEFQLDAIHLSQGVPVLTGTAAVQQINLTYDEPGWEVSSSNAVRIEAIKAAEDTTQAEVLLGPGQAKLFLKPKARDVTSEETQILAEANNLYLPGPGVVDGKHRIHIRTPQGQVSELSVLVPTGLTVSAVTGPIGSWQFDAESRRLELEIAPQQSQAFDILIETQRSLDRLPANVELAPLRVSGSDGEVGLLAVAFGLDAQPEKMTPENMSAVNLGDFDSGLLGNRNAVLHRAYRYGAEGGKLTLRVAPVAPEVRVFTKQVLSLGDERVVMAVNFSAEISRAGLFQLSFPLPSGFEVESLTGDALHHWSELLEGEQRKIVLHLKGKTLGKQSFSLSLTRTTPAPKEDWEIPRFQLEQATRQTGDLIVQPTTGIRLRTVSRQNATEIDPRSMGGQSQGSLAFRLLQRDWNLVLGIEKLKPWITGDVLHDIALREGQTRSTLAASFNVQNASIRSLKIALPITNEEEIKTLRATGKIVSDFVRTAPESNIWEIQFKRRVLDKIEFRVEYERRGSRQNNNEILTPAEFPQARQLAYFFGIRAGGRLEITHDAFPRGWQSSDWNTIPQPLRKLGNRTAPTLALRAAPLAKPLKIQVKRHSLAEALKLRVAKGTLTTVLAPNGDQLTEVDMTIEVIQRSSLTVGLPAQGEIFNIFVNDESVHSIRQGSANTWQFYILPGIDDRTARVRFVYSVRGHGLQTLKLASPLLNVPLENIGWKVITPQGFELTHHAGDLEMVQSIACDNFTRQFYLSKISGKRKVQAEEAAKMLEQANQFLQAGEQSKARRALNSVANRYALDAASNEDARVQLDNLQTQQAIVGLNTRRQRLFLYNEGADVALGGNQQLLKAAADNPILQQERLNYQPQQIHDLLRGNSSENNAVLQRIASRLVHHQRTTEPAPQAITITLPEEGTLYTFGRSVQVAENAPLELDLNFDVRNKTQIWQICLVLLLIVVITAILTTITIPREEVQN